MQNYILSISAGKCGRLSNRCVLWDLNRKIIKRHMTIRVLYSSVALHHLSRILCNTNAPIEFTQRKLRKKEGGKKPSSRFHHSKLKDCVLRQEGHFFYQSHEKIFYYL